MALPQFDVPRYPVLIPSLSKEFTMRPYLVKEEKVLLIALESEDPVQIALAIRNLINSCIEGKDLDLEALTAFDIEWLFLQLRGISVGESMNLTHKCTECEHENPITINTNDVKLSDYDPEGNIIKLGGNIGVTMGYPSLEVINEVGVDRLDSLEGLMEIITRCIVNIFDDENVYDAKKENIEEVTDFIESLTSDQFKMISSFFSKTPRLEYDIDYSCAGCDHENHLELRGLNSFFT